MVRWRSRAAYAQSVDADLAGANEPIRHAETAEEVAFMSGVGQCSRPRLLPEHRCTANG